MSDIDNRLRRALRHGQGLAEAGQLPDFDTVWASAEASVVQRRRRARAIGGLAAAAVVAIVLVVPPRPVEQDWQFVDPDELARSTNWVAPSDVLLPERQFDIYGEIPVLIESTRSDKGALL